MTTICLQTLTRSLVVAAFCAAVIPWTALAATFDVTRTDDPVPDGCQPSDCSLREAILDANANAGPDVIQLLAQSHDLALVGDGDAVGDLDITDDLEIRGVDADSSIVDGKGVDRIFDIHSNVSVAMSHLSIIGGLLQVFEEGAGFRIHNGASLDLSDAEIVGNEARVQGAAAIVNDGTCHLNRVFIGFNTGAGFGGAIVNSTTLTVTDSVIFGNFGENASAIAGGDRSTTTLLRTLVSSNVAEFQAALNFQGEESVLILTDSAVVRNRSLLSYPGGIALGDKAHAEITNSTISDNIAQSRASAFFASDATANFVHATVAEGQVPLFAMWLERGAVFDFRNTIVAESCVLDESSIVSHGGNLEGPFDTCQFDQPSDQTSVTVQQMQLRPLAEVGGPTESIALGATSVARGAAVGECPASDQRGVPRGQLTVGSCDSGATEYTPCSFPNLSVLDDMPAGVTDTLVVNETVVPQDLDVFLGLSHGNVGDVQVELTHTDSGNNAVLVDQPVNASMASCISIDMRVFLDDEAPAPLETSCAPDDFDPAFASTAYQPGDPPAALLANFDGTSLAGTWTLRVSDLIPSTAGVLEAWCLIPNNGSVFADGFESGDLSAWDAVVP